MPKVRMLVSIVGHADPRYKLEDFSFRPGDTPNLHKKLAEAWIAGGLAEPMKAAGPEGAEQESPAAEDPEQGAV